MTIDEQLAEWRDKIARAGSCWGSTDARVADDAKHMLCKLATSEFPRAIAAIGLVDEWCDLMEKTNGLGDKKILKVASELRKSVAAKLAGEV